MQEVNIKYTGSDNAVLELAEVMPNLDSRYINSQEESGALQSLMNLQERGGKFVLTKHKEKVVGFITGVQTEQGYTIKAAYVNSDFRKKGIGRAMVLCIEEALNTFGLEKISATGIDKRNYASQKFFKSQGFTFFPSRGNYFAEKQIVKN